ncbi:DMT family transporter [Compostimonas suwonensis]|nr:DMT family transporter [Compostimonas suwonensis]
MTNPPSAGASPAARRRRVPSAWLGLVFAVVCGALVALQTRINGELGVRLDDGFTAAVISFGSGLLILAVVMAFWPAGRRGLGVVASELRRGRLPWWSVLGGGAGAFLVLSQGIVAAALGVALFTVAIVAGQTVSGLVLDRVGFGPGGRRPVTLPRLLGAVLVLVAVGWAVSDQLQHDVPFWMLLLPLIAGVGLAWQQAVNARVRIVADSALTATFINFLVGTVVLVIAMLVHALSAGWPDALPSDPWLYLGGAIGTVFIAGAAVLVRSTGVLLFGLASVAGQLLAALLIDATSPTAAQAIDGATIGGTLLAVVAVVIAGIRWRRRASPAAGSAPR